MPDVYKRQDLDCVIAAIGTSPNPLIRTTTPGLDTNRKGCIVADEEHGITSKAVSYTHLKNTTFIMMDMAAKSII